MTSPLGNKSSESPEEWKKLDTEVAEKVMGLERCSGSFWWRPTGMAVGDLRRQPLPAYSTSISDAWRVVERMLADGWTPCVEAERSINGPFWRCIMGHELKDATCADADSAPEAVCRAALAATTTTETPTDG